jgi:hypothetical protein
MNNTGPVTYINQIIWDSLKFQTELTLLAAQLSCFLHEEILSDSFLLLLLLLLLFFILYL